MMRQTTHTGRNTSRTDARRTAPVPAAIPPEPAFAVERAVAEQLIGEYDRATAKQMLGVIAVH